MANPSVLNADTVLFSAAEPDGRMFPNGSEWPGDAWSANRGGEPVGKPATAQAMKDLIGAQDKIDAQSEQLARKDHDLAVMAAQRDEANGKVSGLEQRAIAAEQGRSKAEAAAHDYMVERDAARADLQRTSDQLTEARSRVEKAEADAAKVPELMAQIDAANQTVADLNDKLAKVSAKPAKAAAPAAEAEETT